MKTKQFFTAAAVASLCLTSVFAGGEGWTQDLAAAKKQAGTENKNLLLDFTGSDWCPPCIKLSEQILSQEEFRDPAQQHFVLVELDFPRKPENVEAQPEEIRERNQKLAQEYGIEGYPTLFLTDAEGKPYARTGFRDESPQEYVAHLNELREKKEVRDKAFAAAAEAEGTAKAKELITALEAMELADVAVATFYPEVVDQIKTADPQDETGFAAKLAAKQKFAEFENELNSFAAQQDMDGALALVEKTAASGDFEGESQQQILATKAMILARMEKFDDAVKAVDDAKKAAPDSEVAGQLDGLKSQLEAAKSQAGGGENKEDAAE